MIYVLTVGYLARPCTCHTTSGSQGLKFEHKGEYYPTLIRAQLMHIAHTEQYMPSCLQFGWVGYFQMFDDTSQTTNHGSQWQCLACDSPHTERDLPSLQKHFASQHNVLNLLSSPATQVFVKNSLCSSSLSHHRQLYRQVDYQAVTLIRATKAKPSLVASSVEERGCRRKMWENT